MGFRFNRRIPARTAGRFMRGLPASGKGTIQPHRRDEHHDLARFGRHHEDCLESLIKRVNTSGWKESGKADVGRDAGIAAIWTAIPQRAEWLAGPKSNVNPEPGRDAWRQKTRR